jgi:hypothetical protein
VIAHESREGTCKAAKAIREVDREDVNVIRIAKVHQVPDYVVHAAGLIGRSKPGQQAREIENAWTGLETDPRDSVSACPHPKPSYARIVLLRQAIMPSARKQIEPTAILQAMVRALEAGEKEALEQRPDRRGMTMNKWFQEALAYT